MTEKQLRELVVSTAQTYLGSNELDGSHRKIIDIYNGHTPLARKHKVTYSDAWCATFVSAIAIACGLTDIMPTECGCGQMIELYRKLNRWEERDDYRDVRPGDVIFYDWDDSGNGDDTGWPEHVGIVCEVGEAWLKIIEGNLSNAVKYRQMAKNGRYIRGYGLPDYAAKADETETQPAVQPDTFSVSMKPVKNGDKGDIVRALQVLLICNGYSCGRYGIDGDFGSDTESALKSFQRDHGLTATGITNQETMHKLLGVT